jgi:hypothetical protein
MKDGTRGEHWPATATSTETAGTARHLSWRCCDEPYGGSSPAPKGAHRQ